MQTQFEPAELLRRAAVLNSLSRAFAYPDVSARCALTNTLAPLEAHRLYSPKVTQRLRRARRAYVAAPDETMRAEYARLFLGHAPCPLHETAYGDARRIAGRAAELADISGFYTAFGFEASAGEPDLPDHLCAELEFYSLLLVKLAYVGRRGWSAGREVTTRGARKFVEDHLGRWIGAFAAQLRTHDAAAPYRQLADALEALVADEIKRLRVHPSSAIGRLPRDVMQDDEFACPRQDAAEAAAA